MLFLLLKLAGSTTVPLRTRLLTGTTPAALALLLLATTAKKTLLVLLTARTKALERTLVHLA